MKKGFVLYKDNYESIKLLSIEEQAELLRAIFEYNIHGKTENLSHSVNLIFSFMKRQLDRDIERYHNICERNHLNGLKGGRPSKTQNNPDNPVGCLVTQDNPNKPIMISDNDIDKDKDIIVHPHKKPTIEEIKLYCQERNNTVDASKFFDYYESNGWHVGRNKMKDWRASIRTWEKSNYNKGGNSNGKSKFEQSIEAGRQFINENSIV